MSKKSVLDALEESELRPSGGFPPFLSDPSFDAGTRGQSSTGGKASRGRGTSAIRGRGQKPALEFAFFPKTPGILPPLDTPSGKYKSYKESSSSSSGTADNLSRGARCVSASTGQHVAASVTSPEVSRRVSLVRHRSLLAANPVSSPSLLSSHPATPESLSPVVEPACKRKRQKLPRTPAGGAHNPVCVDDSSCDEEETAKAGTAGPSRPKSPDSHASARYFPSPDTFLGQAKPRPPISTRGAASGPSLMDSTFPLECFYVETVYVGTLPGIVVGAVAVEEERESVYKVTFRMTVAPDDIPVLIPVKNVTQWEYGDSASQGGVLRLKLTPAASAIMRAKAPDSFKKTTLNPESSDPLLAYVTFCLQSKLSESQQYNLREVAAKCNSQMSDQSWVKLSAEDVAAIEAELVRRSEDALQSLQNAREKSNTNGSSTSFYGGTYARATRTSTRIQTLQTMQEVSKRSSSSSSSDWMSSLPDNYQKPLPEANPRELLTYPPPPQPSGIAVTSNDLLCLQPQEFLNDSIIDFYLKYLYHNLSAEEQQRVYMFNSFFYRRLTQAPAASTRSKTPRLATDPSARTEMHDRVKKWTRNVDLFDKDFIFIPINEHAHWFLAVICFPGTTGPVRYDNEPVKEEKSGASADVTAGSGTSSNFAEADLNEDPLEDSSFGLRSLSDAYADSSDERDDSAGEQTMDVEEVEPGAAEPEHVLSDDDDEEEEVGGYRPNLLPSEPSSSDLSPAGVLDDHGDADGGYGRLLADGSALLSEKYAHGAPSHVSLQDAVAMCSQDGDSSTGPPPVLRVDCSLGRSIALGEDPERNKMDATLYSTPAESGDKESCQPISNWPIKSSNLQTAYGSKSTGTKKRVALKRKGKGRGRPPLTRPQSSRPIRLKSQPCILLFDSLGTRAKNRVSSNLKSYLTEEWRAKRGTEPVFDFLTMKCSYPKVPQQDNYCDCGVFVLQYVESMLKNPIPSYSLPMNLRDWFTQKVVFGKRQAIIDLILQLEKEKQQQQQQGVT